MNEDNGIHFLAMEFVPGQSLGELLGKRGRLEEPLALAIVADVARALAEAHQRGIVHRDVKPANILLTDADATVKLADFGLARHIVESASLHLTREGAAVGTALYMAPEQAAGQTVEPSADVYSLGATLYHMLAGRPPFLAETALAVSLMHANEPFVPLPRVNPDVSPGLCQMIDKALAKQAADRYLNGTAMLRDLERLLRGEPTNIAIHPRLPACDPARLLRSMNGPGIWKLPPEQLWPYVSNTERLNRAIALSAVNYTTESVAPVSPGFRPRVRRFGQVRRAGFTNAWEEHPFEWVEGRWQAVLREFDQGVFRWMASTTELKPRAGGGTTLTHRLMIEPRNWFGRLVAAIEVGVKVRRQLEQVYRRTDDFVCGRLGGRADADPFETPPPLSAARRRRLDQLLAKLVASGVDSAVASRFGEFLASASPQEVARIRPLAFSHAALGLEADFKLIAALSAASEVSPRACGPALGSRLSHLSSAGFHRGHPACSRRPRSLRGLQPGFHARFLEQRRDDFSGSPGTARHGVAHLLHRRSRSLSAHRGPGAHPGRRAPRD